MKVSKLETGFETGWLGKHVKKNVENLEYWTFEVLTSTHECSVVLRAGEEREGLSLPVKSL